MSGTSPKRACVLACDAPAVCEGTKGGRGDEAALALALAFAQASHRRPSSQEGGRYISSCSQDVAVLGARTEKLTFLIT